MGAGRPKGTYVVTEVTMLLAASSSSPRYTSDLEQARPQTSGEEELQLQLALAMSREEAEKVRLQLGWCGKRSGGSKERCPDALHSSLLGSSTLGPKAQSCFQGQHRACPHP